MGARESDGRDLPATSGATLRAVRATPQAGLSRRLLMRRAIGAGIGLWAVEMIGGTAGFLWSAVTAAAPRVRVGTYGEQVVMQGVLPFADGFPGYVPEARAFLVIVDPARDR